MAYRLKKASLQAAVRHVCRYGDTDIFPHLSELAFIADEQDAVITELASLDLDTYTPAGAIEALAPKSRYGFRIAHQLPILDTLLLLACVVEIGDSIESKRQSVRTATAFSYRFRVDADSGQIFRDDRTYKDWLHKQNAVVLGDSKISKIISTDISDFYSRINFHRLENLLDECAPRHGAGRFVKKHIKTIRAKQSFGLPVGGSAARLLAELSLSDTDQALVDKGLVATRFVDDFRILLKRSQDPYDALGYLAEQLAINEGLSLNVAKTAISSRREYLRQLKKLTTDVAEEAQGVALDVLTASLYFDDDPDENDLEILRGLNLLEFLEAEIGAENWDMGRIKVIFRALKIAKPLRAIVFIKRKFSHLIVFARELCLLMGALEKEKPHCFDSIIDDVIEAILTPPASSVQVIRTWLIELFVRGTIRIPTAKLRQLETLSATNDRRQLHLIRGRNDDKNFFRRQKTAFQTYADAELSSLVWGASCLPKDEYENWLDAIKVNFSRPLGKLYLKWAAKNRNALVSKLEATLLEHPE